MEQFRFENVTLGYNGQDVITDLSFEIKKGDFVCIVGPNGSGKTTLVRAMLGLIPTIRGRVYRNCKGIGYLGQSAQTLRDFPATVQETVLSGTLSRHRFLPFYTKADRRIAHDNMKRVQVDGIAQKSFFELSGGQRQRVLIARAMSATQDVLLVDEPLNNLDTHSANIFTDAVSKLHKNGVTVIMITHTALPELANVVIHVDKTVSVERSGDNA